MAYGLAVADLNGEGLADIAACWPGAGEWFPGFTTGDFNGDGLLDMAVSGYSNPPTTVDAGGDVVLLLGDGDGGYQPATVAVSAMCPTGLAPFGPVSAPRALAIADSCAGGITISGDASRH